MQFTNLFLVLMAGVALAAPGLMAREAAAECGRHCGVCCQVTTSSTPNDQRV